VYRHAVTQNLSEEALIDINLKTVHLAFCDRAHHCKQT